MQLQILQTALLGCVKCTLGERSKLLVRLHLLLCSTTHCACTRRPNKASARSAISDAPASISNKFSGVKACVQWACLRFRISSSCQRCGARRAVCNCAWVQNVFGWQMHASHDPRKLRSYTILQLHAGAPRKSREACLHTRSSWIRLEMLRAACAPGGAMSMPRRVQNNIKLWIRAH
jgi:hypothetical protein